MAVDVTTLFAQRRTLLCTALEPLIAAGKIPRQVLVALDQLYARHRYFEAERIAGLALWVGKESRTAWRETCFEGFGTLLRASLTVVQGLAAMEAHHAWETHAGSREDFLTTCGLSLPLYTRWCHLGQRLFPLSAESLPERGRRVGQLLQWLCGSAAPTEIGTRQTQEWSAAASTRPVVEAAAAEAVQAIHTVSHCLWHVWVQRAWVPVVSSCAVLLEQELGVGTALGHALIALGQDSVVWDVHPHPLARLEVVVTLLAQQTTVAASLRATNTEDRG